MLGLMEETVIHQYHSITDSLQKISLLSLALCIGQFLYIPSTMAQAWHLKLAHTLNTPTIQEAPSPSVSAVKRYTHQTIATRSPILNKATNTSNTMSLEQAKVLLDYRQYDQVIHGMRQFTRSHPKHAQAWHLLAQALEADHRPIEAKQARLRARALGGEKAQRWHASLQLASLVDSNVVVAPNELTLAARDKGDIGGSVQLRLSGQLFAYAHGNTSASFQYNDMLYQDFNSFALRRLSGNITQQVDISKHHFQAALKVEQATLGNASFYAGYYGELSSDIILTTSSQLHIGIQMGRRNFSQAFTPFSAWRTHVGAVLKTEQETWNTALSSTFAIENSKGYEEAFRLNRLALKANTQIIKPSPSQSIWFGGQIGAERRYYLHKDARPFLITPLTRLDRMYSADASLTWQKTHTLWGANIPESWFFKTGWMKNNSNFNTLTTLTATDSRSWRRWWINLGVSWNY